MLLVRDDGGARYISATFLHFFVVVYSASVFVSSSFPLGGWVWFCVADFFFPGSVPVLAEKRVSANGVGCARARDGYGYGRAGFKGFFFFWFAFSGNGRWVFDEGQGG